MKKITDLDNWDAFEQWLKELYEERRQLKGNQNSSYVSDLLFRGQPNADWSLATILERYAAQKPDLLRVDAYYRCIHAAKPEIETYTGGRWELDHPPRYAERIGKTPFVHEWLGGRLMNTWCSFDTTAFRHRCWIGPARRTWLLSLRLEMRRQRTVA